VEFILKISHSVLSARVSWIIN